MGVRETWAVTQVGLWGGKEQSMSSMACSRSLPMQGSGVGAGIPVRKESIVSTVTCSGSEQVGAGGGCLLKLGFFLTLCPENLVVE